MRKIVLFMHASLDGFVAGPNGEMDWIKVDEEMFDYAGDRTDQSDTALYGRVTYDMMEAYWPTAADQPNPTKHDVEHSQWYKKVGKVVLSKSLKVPAGGNVRVIGDQVEENMRRLKEGPGKEIIIFGSPTAAHTLMQLDLIDDYWLFVNPILLGQGIPVFKNIQGRRGLKLMTSKVFSSGVVCLHHERVGK